MKWFVGLGNPGSEYAKTRHNVGFMAMDAFAKRWGISFKKTKFNALVGEGVVEGHKVSLIKPMTYMNLSGLAVAGFKDFYKVNTEDVIIIYDDLDTLFGKIRLRYQGSPGGHNGIKSIVQHLGTQSFNRIRIGISRPDPGYGIADYVLSNFSREEMKQVPELMQRISEVMEYSLTYSFEQTMAKYN